MLHQALSFSTQNLTILTARDLRKQCTDFHVAHASFKHHFKHHLSGETDVRRMTNAKPSMLMILNEPVVHSSPLSRHHQEAEAIHFDVCRVATVGVTASN